MLVPCRLVTELQNGAFSSGTYAIRMAQQGIGILPVRGIAGHADTAGRHSDPAEFSAQRLGHDRENLLHLPGNGIRRLDVRQQNSEFITAHPGHRVRLTYAAFQPSCDHTKQTITHRMSMDIIDTLEVIDIQKQQSQTVLVAMGRTQTRVQSIIEQRSVSQFCQRIMMGEET